MLFWAHFVLLMMLLSEVVSLRTLAPKTYMLAGTLLLTGVEMAWRQVRKSLESKSDDPGCREDSLDGFSGLNGNKPQETGYFRESISTPKADIPVQVFKALLGDEKFRRHLAEHGRQYYEGISESASDMSKRSREIEIGGLRLVDYSGHFDHSENPPVA